MPPEPAPRARHGVLPFVLGALTAFGPLSIDMYLPALPTIQRDLATTAPATQLTLAAFFAGMGLGQLAYGPLADRFGRKRPLYAGLALYALASLGCALAPDVGALLAMRFVQALGAAAGGVIARAVVRDLYRGAEAARLLSALMLVMGAAPILAPLAGSWLLGAAGWRAIFVVLALLGVACAAFTFASLPETGAPDATAADARVLGGRLRAIVGDPEFASAALAGAAAYAGMFAYIAGSPFVFLGVHHLSSRAYGAVFATNAAGLIAASQLNRLLLARSSPAALLVGASGVLVAAGALLAVLASTGAGGVVGLAAGLFAYVATLGVLGPNATALAMEHQGDRAGVASAVLGASQFGIAAVAASLVGAFNDGTARPMALVMALCGAVTFGLGLVVRRVASGPGAVARPRR